MSERIGVDGDAAVLVAPDQSGDFESVFTLRTEGAEADPVAGYLAPAGVSVRQVRDAVRHERVATWLSPLPTDSAPEGDPNAASGDVLAGLATALGEAAPNGWSGLSVECEALALRMVITVTVTMADGTARLWSPPAMVSQWLHRLRMRDYHPGRGVWFRARFELAPGAPLARDVDSLTPPSLLTPELAADELFLLPRKADAIPRWLLDAAVRSSQTDQPVTGPLETVRLFDGQGATWYRPVLGESERAAILQYLTAAPLVLSSRGLTPDVLAGIDEPVVPMGFHTDGRFVWASATAYYLRVHGVPPPLPLVEHIRAQRHHVGTVPAIVMDRAAALAMGRPWNESEVDAKADQAFRTVESVIIDKRISPRYYSVLAEREGAWCLVRDGDSYRVQWSLDQRSAVVFGDVRQAAAYLAGQLSVNAENLEYQLGEEIPAWQSPLVVLADDPPVESFATLSTVMIGDVEVDRYGSPDGNLVFLADTPFEQRGLPAEFADRPYHRYRISGEPWRVVTVVSAAGGRGYVLPSAISEYLRSGHVEEITQQQRHPGLPPITDGMRAAAARNPGGWVYCADPDVDPRFIEGMPLPVLLGGYKAGPDGQLTGETWLNEDYRPSPRKRGYPEPKTDFELVLGYVAAGWLPSEQLLPVALNSPFILETDGNRGLRISVDNNGRRFLTVYSSPGYVPPNAQSVMQSQGRDLTPALAGLTLIVNPGGNFGIELPGDDLIRASTQPV